MLDVGRDEEYETPIQKTTTPGRGRRFEAGSNSYARRTPNLSTLPMNFTSLRLWLAAGLLALAWHAPAAESLINVNLGSGNKVGTAAAGSATNDYWNAYHLRAPRRAGFIRGTERGRSRHCSTPVPRCF